MGLVEDFERVIEEGEKLEQFSIPPRLKRRIANAYARAIDKALCMSWDGEPDPAFTDRAMFRHAERGIRDHLP